MSKARFLAASLLLTALFLVGLSKGCGTPAATCSPDNCMGCCKGTTCVATPTDSNCGIDGEVCNACAEDEVCKSGVCSAADTCAGCVDADGDCSGGTSKSACGHSGATCKACAATETCDDGRCIAAGCTGCMNGTTCEVGNLKAACGKGGQVCTTCAGAESCQDRKCTAPLGSCTPANNPTGCCDMLGMPQAGNTITACGTGGASCTTCSGTGATCENGVCKKTCGTDCVGCCDGLGVCQPSVDATCGQNGATCVPCGTDAKCSNGTCTSTACSATCSAGCCSGTGPMACKAGDTVALCGSGAKACVKCAVGQACTGGTCVTDPSAKWDFIVLSAVVEPFEPDNDNWDWSSPPDPYLEITTNEAGTIKKWYGPFVDNTITPDYATATSTYVYMGVSTTVTKKVISDVTSATLNKVTHMRMYDSDSSNVAPLSDNDMGQCAVVMSASVYSGATHSLTCQTANNSVGSKWTIYFKVLPHT